MGVEYRIETYDFGRARLADQLRHRLFVVQETSTGLGVWETAPAEGPPDVETQTTDGAVTLLLSGGSPAFRERIIGVILTSLAGVNDHVVFREL